MADPRNDECWDDDDDESPGAAGADSLRGAYEAHGVDGYYRRFGADYRNPHEGSIRAALEATVRAWQPCIGRVLDVAAGSGEATLALRGLGAARVDGVDPYTADAFAARTGQVAERFTFEDVAAGALAGRAYDLVVCSFALHLCEPSRLPTVCQQLALIAPRLLILTPHKRPVLREAWGWRLETERVVERVRSRGYGSLFYS